MPIGRSLESFQSFLWQKIQIYERVNSESIDDMMFKMENHYASVLNQAPSDTLVKVSSESSSLINKHDYSFTIPEICTDLGTSRTTTAHVHFNQPGHSLINLRCVILRGDFKTTAYRFICEQTLIHRLKTRSKGINQDLSFLSTYSYFHMC